MFLFCFNLRDNLICQLYFFLGDVEVYPKTARSPSRNALIGSREEISNDRNDVAA